MQEGEKVRLASEADIAASTRETEVKRAQFQSEIKREQATAAQAGPLSEAKARRRLSPKKFVLSESERRNRFPSRSRKYFGGKKNSKPPL